jgi:small subunit ribosomal protein S17
MNKAPHRQEIRGTVISDKMNKTRVISIDRRIIHGLYHKRLMHQRKLMVHDEKNLSKAGDIVVVRSTRPLSSKKNFTLVKVLESRGVNDDSV